MTIEDLPEGSAPCRGVILIADDTADTRDLYCLYLTSRGFKVITAKDGEAAVEMARRHQPDVIVIDFAMPRLDGMAAIQRLKTDPHTRSTPIIMLTANPLKAAQGGSLHASLDGFVTKPCLPEHLEQHIDSLMSVSRRVAACGSSH